MDPQTLVTLVTFLATSLGVVAYLTRAISSLGDRIDQLDARHTGRMDRLEAKIDRSEASLRAEMQAGFAAIDARFVILEGRLTAPESRLFDVVARTAAAPAEG